MRRILDLFRKRKGNLTFKIYSTSPSLGVFFKQRRNEAGEAERDFLWLSPDFFALRSAVEELSFLFLFFPFSFSFSVWVCRVARSCNTCSVRIASVVSES